MPQRRVDQTYHQSSQTMAHQESFQENKLKLRDRLCNRCRIPGRTKTCAKNEYIIIRNIGQTNAAENFILKNIAIYSLARYS